MATELRIPEVGESVTEVWINRWYKSEGDYVEKDENVAELESDKAGLDLPAPVAGRLSKLTKSEGDMAAPGEVIGYIDESARPDEATKAGAKEETPKKEPKEEEKVEPAVAEEPKPEIPEPRRKAKRAKPGPAREAEAEPLVMPAARRLLAEHELKAEEVEATGPAGRLLKEDVLRHLEATEKQKRDKEATKRKAEVTALVGEEQVVPLSPIRRRIAQRLVEAQHTAALLTTFNEIDMSEVIALRRRYQEEFQKTYGVKLGFMSFFVKAVIDALKLYPGLNAEIRGDNVVYRNYYDIGIAVSTDEGLVVPVVRRAERLSFAEIEQAIDDLGRRARDKKLKLEELRGGTFTITNGGVFGSLLSTPLVNPPQSGVLGMHAIQERPVAREGNVVIRPMMYVALTYDHRLVDGREAVSFLRRIKEAIEDPARMLIEV